MTKLKFDLLDEETAIEAINKVTEIAAAKDIDWALVGGLATALYGGDCKTKNIAIIADAPLPLEKAGELRQGGARYLIKTNRKAVAVDWIIRKDEFKQLFAQALTEAVKINDVPILTPEWLVILKFIHGRFKDQEDAVFLLSRQDLVNRHLIKQRIVKTPEQSLGAWRNTAINAGSI